MVQSPDSYPFLEPPLFLFVLFVISSVNVILLWLPLAKFVFLSLRVGQWIGAEIFMTFISFLTYVILIVFTVMGYRLDTQNSTSLVLFSLIGPYLLLIYLSAYGEARLRRRSSSDIHKISQQQPKKALRLERYQKKWVNVADLNVGDRVEVQPGEEIPCDGVIESGTTSVDESLLTAETTILLKTKGQAVIGSSINRDATIVVRVVLAPQDHFLERMMDHIRESLLHIPRRETTDRWLIIFCVIAVLGVAAAAFFYRFENIYISLSRSLTVLYIATFCQWARLTPIVLAMGLGRVARHGILIRSSTLFKKIAKIDFLFCEKTQTLTKGDFHFSQLFFERGVNQGTFLSSIFSLEAQSSHPLARAMSTHPWYIEIDQHRVEDFQSHPGLGICGRVCERGKRGHFAAVGNQRFLKRFQMQISRAMRERIEDLESMGETVILCGWEGQVKGLMSFTDTLRSDVKSFFAHLRSLRVKPVMITGDHDEMMGHLAYAHGLENIYTRCLPDEKSRKIKNRQEKGHLVGMLSNNLVSIQAIEQADVGLIMETRENMTGKEAAVMVLGSRLLNITDLIQYARRVYQTTKWSLYLGLIYCMAGCLLAFLGFLGPLGALFAVIAVYFLLISYPLWLGRAEFRAK